jgi:2,4-dienoyl-CoA reductase-like NADH-dependent reductase (Old Yellow Enzyme family)
MDLAAALPAAGRPAMPRLSDPFQVKGLHLRNRLVMAPIVTGLAEQGAPGAAQLRWYQERARGGVGLVVVESTAVTEAGRIMPCNLGLWSDGQVPGMARLARAIQGEGVPAVVQLVHGGARSWRADPAGARAGASSVALLPGPAPRPMTEEEILAAVEAFVQAARRARAAGFDGVEIHAAHYYLLSQFLSPRTNHRTDRWGGSRAGRATLALEVTRAVRAQVGPDFLILCRLHSVERLEGGTSTDDLVWFAQELEKAGVDLLDLSGIGTASLGEWQGQPVLNTSSVTPRDVPGGAYAPSAGQVRDAVGIPVATVGKLAEPGLAQAVLDRGQADLVALARPLIADPQAAAKLLAGQDDAIVRCRECLACFAAIRKGAIRCSVNPAI